MKKKNTEQRVKALGWTDGTVADFLKLTPEESALIEMLLRFCIVVSFQIAIRKPNFEIAAYRRLPPAC